MLLDARRFFEMPDFFRKALVPLAATYLATIMCPKGKTLPYARPPVVSLSLPCVLMSHFVIYDPSLLFVFVFDALLCLFVVVTELAVRGDE